MANLGSNKKSPWMKLIEWLYDNEYSHIHHEWFAELAGCNPYNLPIDKWLKEHYPMVWDEYNVSS